MSKRGLAIAVLAALAAPALAQQQQYWGGGYSAGSAQMQDPVNAYGQALVDYNACLGFTGNARRCGAPPEAVQARHQRRSAQQDVRVTDYYCVDRNIRGGQPWSNAMQACTRVQPQQSIGGYGQMYPDAAERDILDAQAGAMNAFSQCVKSSAPGTYCGPPP